MFDMVEEIYRGKGLEIGEAREISADTDLSKSVYVGDAAGRASTAGRKKDHGDTDLKLALNVGLRFLTPEVSSQPTRLLMAGALSQTSSTILSTPAPWVPPEQSRWIRIS
jgi:histidinol phosphatase-like enzyme